MLECARRAGVPHAAPAHHFGDVRGLLTEVAASGFERLTLAITTAVSRDRAADKRLIAGHLAYVRFALPASGPVPPDVSQLSCKPGDSTHRARRRRGVRDPEAGKPADVRGRTHQPIRAAQAWRDPGLLGPGLCGTAWPPSPWKASSDPIRLWKSVIAAIRAALDPQCSDAQRPTQKLGKIAAQSDDGRVGDRMLQRV